MRAFIYLAACNGVLALLLSAFCFINFPFQKVSTETSVASLETDVIDRSRLSAEQIKILNWNLSWIRMNEISWRRAHGATWNAGVFGFAGLGLANLLLALFAYRASRKAMVSNAS